MILLKAGVAQADMVIGEVPDTLPGKGFGGVSGFMAGAAAGGPIGAAIGAGVGWLVGGETHKATGLTIATHTCPVDAADQIVTMLLANNVDPSRWIFVHAHLEPDVPRLIPLTKAGVWIELDGLAWGGDAEHAEILLLLLVEEILKLLRKTPKPLGIPPPSAKKNQSTSKMYTCR